MAFHYGFMIGSVPALIKTLINNSYVVALTKTLLKSKIVQTGKLRNKGRD